MFTETFTGTVYCGETISVEIEGFTVTATIHDDTDHDHPWDNEDGHGPVSDWRKSSDKSPGEMVLNTDRNRARFYDYAEACRLARADGWGVTGGRLEGETARAYAARAALADYERLRRYCADDWSYVGISVTVERAGVELVGDYEHALWGLESDCPDHITASASDMVADALESARAKIAELA